MTSLLDQIQLLLTRDLGAMAREIESFPDDELIWVAPEGISNPAGMLALHGCGNLRHYICHVLGGTDYVRDRTREFSDRSATRQSILEEIASTISSLQTVIPALDASVLDSKYPEQVGGFDLGTQQFLLHLCTHLSFHLGQIGYLRRILTQENLSVDPVSLKAIT